jgi:hypothetical protein
MRTDYDTPAAATLGGSFASVTANVGGTSVGMSMEEEFVNNYDLTLGNNDNYTLSDKMVHYCGGQILQVHWSACKAMKKPEIEKLCLEIYYTAIEELDVEHFDKDARDFFCHSFQKKEEPMCAHSLLWYYNDSRAKICRDVLQYFPKELVTMKSGCGFHESCNEVYANAYRRLGMANAKVKGGTPKCTAEEVEEMYPSQHWEFKKSLALWFVDKKIRRNPQLALHVASVKDDPA